MGTPTGFEFTVRRDGEVLITHHGRAATVLRGTKAAKFLDAVDGDPQGVMARVTGNYKRGNERQANHTKRRR